MRVFIAILGALLLSACAAVPHPSCDKWKNLTYNPERGNEVSLDDLIAANHAHNAACPHGFY